MKRIAAFILASCALLCVTAGAQTAGHSFKKWAVTPPMGWNSWDCYGPTVVEKEVKANADYMAANLAEYGWEYVVVDIRWFVENDKAGGYNQTNPIYVYDQWGRYTPALNRFPSAADGAGFKPLADYVHDKGLKFGIHIMRGLPKIAASKKLPVKGTTGITCDMIASNDSACTWLRDNYKVDYRKPGAQEYYNSIFELYAQWGVDFIKIDDLSRPYHTAEIEMIRKAIDQCGRPMVLSVSPGETPLDKVDHVSNHANMWRTVDDFWDNWSQLNYQFGVCAKWAPYIAHGTWPDADMLPLGKISIRGERGAERYSQFTIDEQYTMMNLWSIFKSPLMFGGDLPQNDAATNALLTNRDVLYMHHWSADNRQVSNIDSKIMWSAIDPANGDRFVALFNAGGSEFVTTRDVLHRSGTISYLTTGYATDFTAQIPAGTRQLALVVTDGGDGYSCDHADWINPIVTLGDGSTLDLTTVTPLRSLVGWGDMHVNSNIEGGKLSIDGKKYDKGFAVHANSILVFDIPENAVAFSALAGIDNTGTDQGSSSSVEFMVFPYDPTMRQEYTDWNAGNKLVNVDPSRQADCSGLMSRKSAKRTVRLNADIKDIDKLYLVVTNGGDNLSYDHADWVNPTLVKADGTEVSLTDIRWDANPLNGWNAPQLNKNNDGNTLAVDGVKYDKGFGVNAPSVLTFSLPENHDYVKFTSLVGLDDDILDAPSGATVEFRVYTQDPAPNEVADMALDLAAIGFEPDRKAAITEMWEGKELGTFKGSEYVTPIRAHASALYRVHPLDRATTASATLSIEKIEDNDYSMPFMVKVAVSGGDREGAFVQLKRNGAIIATLTPDAEGNASYVCDGIDHTSNFQAIYSGTIATEPCASNAVSVTPASVTESRADYNSLKISAGKGYVDIKSSTGEEILDIYRCDGTIARRIHAQIGDNRILIEPGVYIVAGKTTYVR